MNKKKKLLLQKIASFLVSIILLVFLMFIVGEYQHEIVFEDHGLEAAIRKNLKKNKGKISNGDVLHITYLNASDKNIQSLKGIENLHRLVELNLNNNRVKDIEFLSRLKKLKVLRLDNNQIISLKSVNFQLLPTDKLCELSLCNNFLQSKEDKTGKYCSDVSILSQFINLEILKLRNNDIEDISFLENNKNLKKLDLRGNKILNINPLRNLINLEELNLRENSIKDISPLADLIKLKYLNIHSNSLIEEFYPLEKLNNLETLIMQNVPVGKNIKVILKMPKLNNLNLRNCCIEDISAIAELMSKGGIQDKKDSKAKVDIRKNNLIINDADSYFTVMQRWNNITYRYPYNFPTPYNIEQPVFSQSAGYYKKTFKLKLTHTDPDAAIYYTLDGSRPDPKKIMTDKEYSELLVEDRSRTFLYDNPIDVSKYIKRSNEISMIKTNIRVEAWIEPRGNIQKAVIVRAIAKSKEIFSKEKAATYFIDSKGNKRYNLPVVSIATDRSNLFNFFLGIYVPGIHYVEGNNKTGNFYQKGIIWKKPAYFELFDKNGELSLSKNVSIQIHGGVSRSYSLKALRIYAKNDYDGIDQFNYPFFDSKSIETFNGIILKNSGNDSTKTLFRDAAIQTLIQHMSLDTQHFQPSIVFINGEYWGIHSFRDFYDEHYIENHYKIPKNEVVIIERNRDDKDDTPLVRKYKEQHRDMENNIIQGNLNTWEKIDKYMNVSEYIDYLIIHFYTANTDWPNRNVQFWRYAGKNISDIHGPFDGRWRWMVFDLDLGFINAEFNMLHYILVKNSYAWARKLIRGVLAAEDVRHEFIQRSAVHMNTVFRPEYVKNHIFKLASIIESEVPEHSARWGLPTIKGWYDEVDLMKNFSEKRPLYFLKHMDEHFDEITGTANLIISNIDPKSDILLHTILLKKSTPGVLIENKTWKGIMFTGDAPVKLYSSNFNLKSVSIEGAYQIIEKTEKSLIFKISGDVRIKIE